MKSSTRAELIAIFDEMSSIAPELRLGQMLNMFTGATDLEGHPNAVYEIEDDDLIIEARFYLNAFRKRHEEYQELGTMPKSSPLNSRQNVTAS